jgi:shikimate dehydrogenase
MISGRTRVFALLGNPVSHSLSPAMYNAAFRAQGLDAVYVALRCEASELEPLMRGLSRAGGGGNVTIPHKRGAAGLVRPAGGSLVGCNTFWGEGGELIGDDTDSLGIRAVFERLGSPAGRWMVLGSGGSAVAAAVAAGSVGAGVAIRSRSAGRRAALAAELRTLGIEVGPETGIGLVLNCTPLGMDRADPLPLPVGDIPAGAAVVDLVYGRPETQWVRQARAAGHRAADGQEVLIAQGAAAFERWFPDSKAPIEVMRAAVAGRLG